MKPEELRIGNWIDDFGDGPGQVLAIDKDGYILTTANDVYQPHETFKPIPLTEQWLKDFGWIPTNTKEDQFYYEVHQWNTYTLRFNLLSKEISSLGVLTCDEHGNVDGLTNFAWNIKTVHRFQNIMFSLTGTELTKHP